MSIQTCDQDITRPIIINIINNSRCFCEYLWKRLIFVNIGFGLVKGIWFYTVLDNKSNNIENKVNKCSGNMFLLIGFFLLTTGTHLMGLHSKNFQWCYSYMFFVLVLHYIWIRFKGTVKSYKGWTGCSWTWPRIQDAVLHLLQVGGWV